MTIVRAYRASLRLYPRRFRAEYGDDMVALFEDQLRDEHTARVVGRAALDLALSAPTRHLEAHMHRTSTTALVVTFVAVAVAVAAVGGPLGLTGALGLLVLAAIAWRRSRPVGGAADGGWWKLLLGGLALLGLLIVITSATGELPEGGWFVAMTALFTSFALIGAGIVLGIAGRFRTSAP